MAGEASRFQRSGLTQVVAKPIALARPVAEFVMWQSGHKKTGHSYSKHPVRSHRVDNIGANIIGELVLSYSITVAPPPSVAPHTVNLHKKTGHSYSKHPIRSHRVDNIGANIIGELVLSYSITVAPPPSVVPQFDRSRTRTSVQTQVDSARLVGLQ